MALTKIDESLLDIISKLADEPNDVGGMGAAELKAKFDEAGKLIANYINKTLIPEITSDIDAAAQGIPSGGGISGNILAPLSITDDKIKNVNGSKIDDGTISTEKHAKGSITRELLAENAKTVQTEDFPNKVVPNRALADNAVTSVKIDEGAVTAEKLGEDAKSRGVAVVLSASGWSDNSQTVAVEHVTATANIVVSAAPNSRTEYNDAEIYCAAQGEGSLAFKCSTVPATEVTANVIILV